MLKKVFVFVGLLTNLLVAANFQGGTEIKIKEAPYIVAILHSRYWQKMFVGTGVLINENIVMTSCDINTYSGDYYVSVGSSYYNEGDLIQVDYEERHEDSSISLLMLRENVTFSANVKAIPSISSKSNAIVFGYGNNVNDGYHLVENQATIVSQSMCKDNNDSICVQYPSEECVPNNKAFCSPLFAENELKGFSLDYYSEQCRDKFDKYVPVRSIRNWFGRVLLSAHLGSEIIKFDSFNFRNKEYVLIR